MNHVNSSNKRRGENGHFSDSENTVAGEIKRDMSAAPSSLIKSKNTSNIKDLSSTLKSSSSFKSGGMYKVTDIYKDASRTLKSSLGVVQDESTRDLTLCVKTSQGSYKAVKFGGIVHSRAKKTITKANKGIKTSAKGIKGIKSGVNIKKIPSSAASGIIGGFSAAAQNLKNVDDENVKLAGDAVTGTIKAARFTIDNTRRGVRAINRYIKTGRAKQAQHLPKTAVKTTTKTTAKTATKTTAKTATKTTAKTATRTTAKTATKTTAKTATKTTAKTATKATVKTATKATVSAVGKLAAKAAAAKGVAAAVKASKAVVATVVKGAKYIAIIAAAILIIVLLFTAAQALIATLFGGHAVLILDCGTRVELNIEEFLLCESEGIPALRQEAVYYIAGLLSSNAASHDIVRFKFFGELGWNSRYDDLTEAYSTIDSVFLPESTLENIIRPIFTAIILDRYALEIERERGFELLAEIWEHLFAVHTIHLTEVCVIEETGVLLGGGTPLICSYCGTNYARVSMSPSEENCPNPYIGVHTTFECEACCSIETSEGSDDEPDQEEHSCSGFEHCLTHSVVEVYLETYGFWELLNIYFFDEIEVLYNTPNRTQEQTQRMMMLEDMAIYAIELMRVIGGFFGGGNESIAQAALTLALIDRGTLPNPQPLATSRSQGCGTFNSPAAAAYRSIFIQIFGGDTYFASCCRGAATAIRWAGADDSFPAGAVRTQLEHLRNSNRWAEVGPWITNETLVPGDILIYSIPAANQGHIMIYVGNDLIQTRWPESISNIYDASIGGIGRLPAVSRHNGPGGKPYIVFRNVEVEENSAFSGLMP